MKISALIGWGIGAGVAYGIYRAVSTSNNNRQVSIGREHIANNAGYVIYQEKEYPINEILQQTSDLELSAYEAQQAISRNSTDGQTIALAIGQIERLRGTENIL